MQLRWGIGFPGGLRPGTSPPALACPEEIRAKLDPGVYLVAVRPAATVKVAGQPGGDPDEW